MIPLVESGLSEIGKEIRKNLLFKNIFDSCLLCKCIFSSKAAFYFHVSEKLKLPITSGQRDHFISFLRTTLPEKSNEDYDLVITPTNIIVQAEGQAGAFYGAQSLVSLWEAGGGEVPILDIKDKPRYYLFHHLFQLTKPCGSLRCYFARLNPVVSGYSELLYIVLLTSKQSSLYESLINFILFSTPGIDMWPSSARPSYDGGFLLVLCLLIFITFLKWLLCILKKMFLIPLISFFGRS